MNARLHIALLAALLAVCLMPSINAKPIADMDRYTITVPGGFPGLVFTKVRTHTDAAAPPLGKGRSIELYLTSEDGCEYGPIVLWISSAREKPILVNSIASANVVLQELSLNDSPESRDIALNTVMSALTPQLPVDGESTGFVLVGGTHVRFLDVLKESVSPDEYERLAKYLEKPTTEIDGKNWKRSWVEVDRLGAVERVSASGSLSPWAIKRVLRESVLGPGSIPLEMLRYTTVYRTVRQR